jgi:hypothetical protein
MEQRTATLGLLLTLHPGPKEGLRLLHITKITLNNLK